MNRVHVWDEEEKKEKVKYLEPQKAMAE